MTELIVRPLHQRCADAGRWILLAGCAAIVLVPLGCWRWNYGNSAGDLALALLGFFASGTAIVLGARGSPERDRALAWAGLTLGALSPLVPTMTCAFLLGGPAIGWLVLGSAIPSLARLGAARLGSAEKLLSLSLVLCAFGLLARHTFVTAARGSAGFEVLFWSILGAQLVALFVLRVSAPIRTERRRVAAVLSALALVAPCAFVMIAVNFED